MKKIALLTLLLINLSLSFSLPRNQASPAIFSVTKTNNSILFRHTDSTLTAIPCQSVASIVSNADPSKIVSVWVVQQGDYDKIMQFDYSVCGFLSKSDAVDSLTAWAICDTSSGGGGGGGDVTQSALDDTSSALNSRISAKQNTLVSGTNIKTINSTTLLGSGNLPINVGVVYDADSIRLYVIGGTDTIVFGYAVRGLAYASDTLSWYEGGTRYAEYIGGGGGGGSLSSLTAATATNNIQNENYKQRWNWNTLAGDTAMVIASNSTAAASNLQNLLTVWQSGVNSTPLQTTYAARFINDKGGATNIGAYFQALNATTNYSAEFLGDIKMNTYSNIRMGSSNSQIYFSSGNGVLFNSTNQGIKYNSVGYIDYFAGSTYHIFTSTKTLPFVIAATASTNYLSFAKPSTNQNSIIFNGDYESGSYRGETTFSNTINAANGILKIAANTGQTGGYAAFTPNYVLTVKPTTCINLTPITATAASAITPAEGDLLFVSTTDATFTSIGLWCYENGAWSKK